MKLFATKVILGTLIYSLSALAMAGGLKLKFQINEDFLICHTFSKKMRRSSTPNVMKFRSELENSFNDELKFLQNLEELNPEVIRAEYSRLESLINTAKSLSTYSQLLSETNEHLKEVRSEWDRNYENTSAFMSSLTRISFDKQIDVFITHPEVFQGRYLFNNAIAWGTKSAWPNYSTVYLWHEVLHSYLKFNGGTHAMIELMTDDALRVHLNGGTFPPYTEYGHDDLVETKKWIYENFWADYLSHPEKNIFQLEEEILQGINK